MGTRRKLRYLDLSNTNMDDEKVAALTNSAKANGARVKKLSLANAGGLTDEGIKQIGATLAGSLTDFCMAGCFKITDLGLMLVRFPRLERLNYCGSYKVTDASRRYVLSQNPTLLIYNSIAQFGRLAGFARDVAKDTRRGGFYDSESENEDEGQEEGEKGEKEKYADFVRSVNG